ncbi:LysR substrate-binding domain-containing protein [Amycolatopsis sp. NPDC023774]|uniref:LysR substrate-binding domain-containing protein n=1 Tax=Amycolatopsis sp. NPDC023774 TaxID=3155015 RepID=UPI0033E44AA2
MEIRELRAFVAVVDEGGVSAAARRLHVSQSALSQTMRTLEAQAGATLLVRDHNGARPTELGAVLLVEARALVEQHDRLVATITRAGAGSDGELRVGVPLELPADLLPTAIAEVRAGHPDVRVLVRHARSTVQLAELKAGELDLALVRDRPDDPRLDSVLAVEEAMGVILTSARSAELREADGVRLHRLAGLSWIGFARSDAPAWHDQVRATLRSHGVSGVDPAVVADQPVPSEVKLAAVATGRAFALASPGWGQALPDGLLWHPLAGHPVVRRTWAVWQAEARQRALATLVAALDVTGR